METYDTSDYQLAVTLSTMGYRLLVVDKENPRRAIFKFELVQPIAEDAEAFFQDMVTLNPREVLTHSKLIKGRLYAGA